jgi:hypothetical protein
MGCLCCLVQRNRLIRRYRKWNMIHRNFELTWAMIHLFERSENKHEASLYQYYSFRSHYAAIVGGKMFWRTLLPGLGYFYARVPIRPVFPGTIPFFIQMSRVNFKSPAFSKHPSVFSLINAIWTDENIPGQSPFYTNVLSQFQKSRFLKVSFCILINKCDLDRWIHPATVPFFIQMSRVNVKSPAPSKYPSVFSLINAIWTDKNIPGQSSCIQMSRVNFKSPAFSKYPSVFSLINAIWTDEKIPGQSPFIYKWPEPISKVPLFLNILLYSH